MQAPQPPAPCSGAARPARLVQMVSCRSQAAGPGSACSPGVGGARLCPGQEAVGNGRQSSQASGVGSSDARRQGQHPSPMPPRPCLPRGLRIWLPVHAAPALRELQGKTRAPSPVGRALGRPALTRLSPCPQMKSVAHLPWKAFTYKVGVLPAQALGHRPSWPRRVSRASVQGRWGLGGGFSFKHRAPQWPWKPGVPAPAP